MTNVMNGDCSFIPFFPLKITKQLALGIAQHGIMQ